MITVSLFGINSLSVIFFYTITGLVKEASINLALHTIPFVWFGLVLYIIITFLIFLYAVKCYKNIFYASKLGGLVFKSNFVLHTFVALPMVCYTVGNFYIVQIAFCPFA